MSGSWIDTADQSGTFQLYRDQPDLAVTPPIWTAGQGVTFSYTISDADLIEPTAVGLYWSTDMSFDKDKDTQAFSTTTQMGHSQDPYTVPVNHNQLTAPPQGTKYLLAVIDPNNTVAESDEPNYPTDFGPNNVKTLPLQDTIAIKSPIQGSVIFMTSTDGRTANVPLDVAVGGFVTGNVDWKFNLHYVSPVTTTVFDYSPPISLSVSDCVGNSFDFAVTGMGGTLTLQASAVVDGTPIVSNTVTAEIRGYQQVPANNIINTLTALQGSLFVGVADLESKFKTENKGQFNLDGTPYITDNVGVGLTQIALRYWKNYDDFATYWDWQVNASRGAAILQFFLSDVDSTAAKIRSKKANANLPALSQIERENWALSLYSGEDKSKDFYEPNASRTAWVVNPKLPSGAKTYVNVVRNRAYEITQDASVLSGLVP
jgi:hypothetical protein